MSSYYQLVLINIDCYSVGTSKRFVLNKNALPYLCTILALGFFVC